MFVFHPSSSKPMSYPVVRCSFVCKEELVLKLGISSDNLYLSPPLFMLRVGLFRDCAANAGVFFICRKLILLLRLDSCFSSIIPANPPKLSIGEVSPAFLFLDNLEVCLVFVSLFIKNAFSPNTWTASTGLFFLIMTMKVFKLCMQSYFSLCSN